MQQHCARQPVPSLLALSCREMDSWWTFFFSPWRRAQVWPLVGFLQAPLAAPCLRCPFFSSGWVVTEVVFFLLQPDEPTDCVSFTQFVELDVSLFLLPSQKESSIDERSFYATLPPPSPADGFSPPFLPPFFLGAAERGPRFFFFRSGCVVQV